MAFNLTGVDVKLYYDANVTVNMTLFTFLVLPPLVLCLLCVLALVFATEINVKIRILLINIFAAEICNWLSYAVSYLGWPIRLLSAENTLCKIFYNIYTINIIQSCTSGAIYAIHIYRFIKHGEKKLKWSVLLTSITISWITATALGLTTYFDNLGAVNINGFCTLDPDSALFKGLLVFIVCLAVSFLIIQIVFSILTVVYVTRNTLEGSTEMKKAVTRVLAYLAVASFLSFINNIMPAANPVIRRILPKDDIVSVIAVYYLLRLVFNVPAIATPVVTIALFKAVRLAIKNMSKKVCVCRPSNRVHPAPEADAVNTEINDTST